MHTTTLFTALFALLPLSLANVFTTSPIDTTKWAADKKQTVQWDDDGKAPSLAALGTLQVDLYTGGPTQQTFLTRLGSVEAKKGKLTTEVDPKIGESGDYYFLRIRSANSSSTSDVFSARFTITGMSGTWNSTVKAQLATINSTSSAAGSSTGKSAATGKAGTKGSDSNSTSVPMVTKTATAAAIVPNATGSGSPTSDAAPAQGRTPMFAALVSLTLVALSMLA